MNKTSRNAIIIVFLVLLMDQLIKILIKTHFLLGEEKSIFGNWFILQFVENEGMAFSLRLPTEYGKILLSVFRLIAIGFIIYMIRRLISEKYHSGLVYCGAMILAGAIGNMIDSTFYGLIFSESSPAFGGHHGHVATAFPPGGGYAGLLKGRVVDMLYFPLYHGELPRWVPIWGGEEVRFFNAIFNIADASITIGVVIIILFQKTFFTHPSADIATPSETHIEETTTPENTEGENQNTITETQS